MNKNSNRKPFGDLTNKMSAVSLSDGIKPKNKANFPPECFEITNSGTMGPSGDDLETIPEESEVGTTVTSSSSSLSSAASPFFPGSLQGASSPPVFLSPPPPVQELLALVMEPGFISLRMGHGVALDIANDLSVRLVNPGQQSSIAMSRDSRHVAVIHPRGRAIVYQPRAEIQVEDRLSVKNAKFYPKGISFTANNLALVYLLDEAGARTTSDTFHDLHGTNIVETLFRERCASQHNSVRSSCEQLDRIRYWRNQVAVPLLA